MAEKRKIRPGWPMLITQRAVHVLNHMFQVDGFDQMAAKLQAGDPFKISWPNDRDYKIFSPYSANFGVHRWPNAGPKTVPEILAIIEPMLNPPLPNPERLLECAA